MGLLQSQPALLKQEVSLRLGLIVTTMEQLTSDDALTFSDMETILSEVHAALSEGLQTCVEGKADCKNGFPHNLFHKCNESLIKSIDSRLNVLCSQLICSFNYHIPECTRKTKELLDDKCSRMESKRKKLLRSQSKEKSQVLENRQVDCDLQQFTKVRTFYLSMVLQTAAHEPKPSFFQAYQHLLMKHRQQISELELQQDNRTAEILCDHWKVRKLGQCFIFLIIIMCVQ